MDSPWKRWERQVAAALGGRRTGPTGRDDPDVSGVEVSPECKYQKRLALKQADIQQAKDNARPGKPWMLALKAHRMSGGLVVMELDTFADIYHRAYPEKEEAVSG